MSEPTDIDNDEEEFAETTLIEAIENQIESDNPPAAKATFNKLTLVGYEREEILQLMAHVLAVEIDAILEEDRAIQHRVVRNCVACPARVAAREEISQPVTALAKPAPHPQLHSSPRSYQKNPQPTLDSSPECVHLRGAIV